MRCPRIIKKFSSGYGVYSRADDKECLYRAGFLDSSKDNRNPEQ